MSDPRVRFTQGFVAGVLTSVAIAAIVVAVLLNPFGASRRSACEFQDSIKMRGLIQALVTHAAQNDGRYPAGDLDWSGVLIRSGMAPVEMLESSDPALKGVPLFLYLPPSGTGLGPFSMTEVLLVQNPATTDGRGGLIGYNDNHVEYLSEPDFSRTVQSLVQGRLGRVPAPVRC